MLILEGYTCALQSRRCCQLWIPRCKIIGTVVLGLRYMEYLVLQAMRESAKKKKKKCNEERHLPCRIVECEY